MLREIWCDKFASNGKVRDPIIFSDGLNTVLGGEKANNSIGKTTFMLIIDFVFGGDTYLRNEAIEKVGPHVINFCFEFNGIRHHFSRSTTTGRVAECDSSYSVIEEHNADWLRDFLFKSYIIKVEDVTFRNIISRYFRIYGKDNCSEKRPLAASHQERLIEQINDLLKLFGKYHIIKDYTEAAQFAEEKLVALRQAQKFGFALPSVTRKSEYDKNLKDIERVEDELRQLERHEQFSLLDMESENASKAGEIKGRISNLKRKKTSLISQMNIVQNNLGETIPFTSGDFLELLSFFPDANMGKIEEIESFHTGIQSILKEELREELGRLQLLVDSIETEIRRHNEQLIELGVPINVSKSYLDKLATYRRQIENMNQQNNGYLQTHELQDEKKNTANRLAEIRESQLRNIESTINQQMVRFNDFVYETTRKAPVLDLKDGKQYTFETPDDTGTGTSYKSLIIFDLSVLSLTELPALAHDSLLLKNIGDEPIDRIMKLYLQSKKQIFIAFDKADAYSADTKRILTDTAVLHLDEGGNELFGYSWNIKE